MGIDQLSVGSFSEREQALTIREADVARREHHVARDQAALESQRERLDAVRAEYESRLELLSARTRELDGERERLRIEHAQLVTVSLQEEQRERAVADAAAEATLVEPPPQSAPPAPVAPAEAPPAVEEPTSVSSPPLSAPPMSFAAKDVGVPDDSEWWAKQLGTPCEAA